MNASGYLFWSSAICFVVSFASFDILLLGSRCSWLWPSVTACGFCDASRIWFVMPMRVPRPVDGFALALQVPTAFLRRETPRSSRWAQTSFQIGPPFSDPKARLKSPLTLGVRMISQQRILHSSDAINYATFAHQFLRTPCLNSRRRCFPADGFALPLFELANMHHAARKIDSQQGCRTGLKKEKC